ncbi:MAG: flavodoxin family protein [Elusimicrobia bacterium]|nr:flavodoxin family protein [Elusimicrobiota bacterium]
MKKIVAINGSYRRGGIIDQAVEAAAAAARAGGASVETVLLAEKNIAFCTNCRSCMQEPGAARGGCPLRDDMDAILDAVDAADGLILAAPVNCFNLTAVFRKFMERGGPYAYWPWGAKAPAMRLAPGARKAVLIASAAMPAPFGRLFTGAMRALKLTAAGTGSKVSGTLFIGLSAMTERPELAAGDRRRAEALGRGLLA